MINENKNYFSLWLINKIRKLFNPISKYFQDIEEIERIKKEEYMRGCLDTTLKLSEEIKNQNQFIENLLKLHTTKLEKLEKETLEHEQALREEYMKRIKEIEIKHSEICNACKNVTDEERKRITFLQNTLNQYLHNSDFIFRKLYNYASKIAEEHNTIMHSTARALSLKNELSYIKDEIDNLSKQAEPYLLVPLTNLKSNDDIESK